MLTAIIIIILLAILDTLLIMACAKLEKESAMKMTDPLEWDDIRTYCEICECDDCPRYGDDCDGKGEEDDDEV